ncbi:MAG: hypothetical protein ACREIL_10435 [Nitrospiraceae bacterium]
MPSNIPADDLRKHLSDLDAVGQTLASLVLEGKLPAVAQHITSESFRLWLEQERVNAIRQFSEPYLAKVEAIMKERDQAQDNLRREKLDRSTERDFAHREYILRIEKLRLEMQDQLTRGIAAARAEMARSVQQFVPFAKRAELNGYLERKGIDLAALAVGRWLGVAGGA